MPIEEKTMVTTTSLNGVPATTGRPQVVNAVIEIPKGHRNKYELDPETGLFVPDRCLFSSSHYPGDYGFVPQTLAGDGDALDVLVMVNEPTFTGCVIRARVIGMFGMHDAGSRDCKLLAVPDSDPTFAEQTDLSGVPPHFLREVENFFVNYKQLEGIKVQSNGWSSVDEAMAELASSQERFRSTDSESSDLESTDSESSGAACKGRSFEG